MRVLMVTNYLAGLNLGGAEVQAVQTARALQTLGVNVTFHAPWNDRLDVDVVHCFGYCAYFEEIAALAKSRGVKVVVSTIFWPPAASMVKNLKQRIWFGLLPHLPIVRRLPEGSASRIFRMADLLLPNSETESALLESVFRLDPRRIVVVPNGVEARFRSASPTLFRKTFGDADFVLNVANVWWQKNQLRLIRTLKDSGKRLVIIGREIQPEYALRCRREGEGWVEFLGPLSHDDPLLMSAYAAAKVFALPSLRETPGLAALEAALAGTRTVVTRAGCAEEYLGTHAWYCDPLDERDIAATVEAAWHAGQHRQAQQAHVGVFTWDKVAHLTLEAYKRIAS